MKTWVLVSRTSIPAGALQSEVEALGGYWVPEMNRGVLQRGEAAIYIDPYEFGYRNELEQEELRSLERELGGEVSFVASIALSHRGTPAELAERFAQAMIEKWGGVLRREE